MNVKIHEFLFALLIFLGSSLSTFSYAATYGGGSGTTADPYQIWTSVQMNTIGTDPNDWGSHFKLMVDIDMSAYTGTQYNIIGNATSEFTGTFDGNGHIISNLTYITTEPINDIGLFGCINNAIIQDLGLENASLSTGGNYVGGLVGWNYETVLTACYATGSVNGNNYIGGLVGLNEGVLTGCHATSSVNGINYVGGLTGENDQGSLTACYSTGSVMGNSYTGGLMGENDEGLLTACYATSSVSGISYVGGLIGRNSSGSLNACYAIGFVSGTNYVGGLEGGDSSGRLSACFWDIQTTGQTKGFGYGASDEAMGITTDAMQTLSTFTDAGWDFVGEQANGLNDYWQMEENDYPHFTIHTWTLEGDGTFPNPFVIANPEDLSKVWLKPTACYRLGGNLDLTGIFWSSAVIPTFSGLFDGQGFVISHLTINQPKSNYVGLFGCVYAGQIRNLCIESASLNGCGYTGGLAGYNVYTTLIACYSSGSVSGTGNSVGGLVGYNYGMLIDCYTTDSVSGNIAVGGLIGLNDGNIVSGYATGSVSGGHQVGGLVGYNRESLTTCYATGSVNGTNYIGGLVGKNSGGGIAACYATGSVNGSSWIGGLVGRYDDGALTVSYAAGPVSGTYYVGGLVGYNYSVSTITSCFWDTQTSEQSSGVGQGDSTGVTSKTTDEMQTLSTFISAGWDFTNETANGTNDYWRMCIDGVNYPRLNWQSIDGDFSCPDGVNTEDLNDYVGWWLMNDCTPDNNYCGGTDMDHSGVVNLADWAIFAGNWLLGI